MNFLEELFHESSLKLMDIILISANTEAEEEWFSHSQLPHNIRYTLIRVIKEKYLDADTMSELKSQFDLLSDRLEAEASAQNTHVKIGFVERCLVNPALDERLHELFSKTKPSSKKLRIEDFETRPSQPAML